MSTLANKFCWYHSCSSTTEEANAEEKYRYITSWARQARGLNPEVFDELTKWLRNAEQWNDPEFAENQKFFTEEILGRFLAQNRVLRAELTRLQPSSIVNPAVFDALDRFDDELSGNTHSQWLKEAVTTVFHDFSALRNQKVRERFAGSLTGPTGTDSVDYFGYINFLKDCDASVQWALFMPELAQQQQKGFQLASFEYKKMPPIRFIGIQGERFQALENVEELEKKLDSLSHYRCGFDYDILLLHHKGRGVDAEPCHKLWGRFVSMDAPIPEGFVSIDFVSQYSQQAGPPYISQFAWAVFAGDTEMMHQREGFDSDAMYDVTRNIILGQNVPIPYPEKYWTAEVFLDGFGKPCTSYLFSINL